MNNKYINIALFLFLLYIFWGWFFNKTIYGRPLYIYLSFISLFVLFFLCLTNTRINNIIPKPIAIWLPFTVWMAGAYIISGSVEHFVYWFIIICILLISKNRIFLSNIHYKQLLWFGLIGVTGIAVQIFAPAYYNTHFSSIWIHDNVEMWLNSGYGFNGFTYQLDTTAFLMIFAEAVCLFLYKNVGITKALYKYFIIALLLIGIALTGKRSIILSSWACPIIVYYVRSKGTSGKFGTVLFVTSIILLILYFITPYIGLVDELPGIGRVSALFESSGNVDDVSSGRRRLWKIAMNLFDQNPIFGIGVGRYVYVSGTGTNAHNSYLELLCETGLWGFSLFIVPMFMTFFRTINLIHKRTGETKDYLSFSLFVQLFMIVYSVSGNTFINLPCYMMYFISISLMNNVSKKNINEFKKVYI